VVPGSVDSEIVPPLVVIEGVDTIRAVHVFRSVAALDRFLEPWFPAEEAYRAYDSQGRKLMLTLEDESVRRRWRRDKAYTHVSARLAESDPLHGAELATLLRRRLREADPTAATDNLSLRQLVLATIEREKVIE
jgi:hypothetical protein